MSCGSEDCGCTERFDRGSKKTLAIIEAKDCGDGSCGCGCGDFVELDRKVSLPVIEEGLDCGDGSCGCGCVDVSEKD